MHPSGVNDIKRNLQLASHNEEQLEILIERVIAVVILKFYFYSIVYVHSLLYY